MPSINSHKTWEERAAEQRACRRLAEALASDPRSDRDRMGIMFDQVIDFLEQPPLSMSVETMEFLLAAAASLREDILTASGETVR
jgi:hypothetical protein